MDVSSRQLTLVQVKFEGQIFFCFKEELYSKTPLTLVEDLPRWVKDLRVEPQVLKNDYGLETENFLFLPEAFTSSDAKENDIYLKVGEICVSETRKLCDSFLNMKGFVSKLNGNFYGVRLDSFRDGPGGFNQYEKFILVLENVSSDENCLSQILNCIVHENKGYVIIEKLEL